MKKIVSFLLTALLFISSALPVSAQELLISSKTKVSLKEAIEIAKSQLEIKTEGYEFTNSLQEREGNKSIWNLCWRGGKNVNSEINVSIDANTGDIISMYRWSRNDKYSKIPKYTRDNALDAAKKFISKLQPEKSKYVKILEEPRYQANSYDYYSNTYYFNFVRTINGINCNQNGMNMEIDKNTLEVKHYNFNWDNLSYPEVSKAMDIDSAKKIFNDKLGLELACNLIYKNGEKSPTPILVYALNKGNNPIDAITGEVLKNYWFIDERDMGTGAKAESKNMADKVVLTPEEINSIDENSKLISKDAAIEALKKYIPLEDKYKLEYSNLYKDSNNNPYWSFSWNYNNPSENKYGYLSGEVNAKTGEIKSFSIDGTAVNPNKDNTPSYTMDTAKLAAENFLNGIQPDKFNLLQLRDNYDEESVEKPSSYTFNYIGKLDGILCSFDSVSVTVNAYTGKIIRYNINWMDIKLPSKEGIISLEDAYKVLYSKMDFAKRYIVYPNLKNNVENKEIRLIYSFDNIWGTIDAKNGELIDYSGNVLKEKTKVEFTDIKGSAAEAAIKILIDMNIINDTTSKFNTNSAIIQKDFIKYIVRSMELVYIASSNNEYDEYYKIAIERKLISEKEKKPEALVTRQEASKIFIRALGFGYIAERTKLYSAPYKDVKQLGEKYKGYAAISNDLGIITANGGYFYATKNVTRGDAAVFILNYLKVDPELAE